MNRITRLLPLLAWLPMGWAMAADFDGSKPLICATVEAHDCALGGPCSKGLAIDVGAPQFLRIDIAKKIIIGPNRTTDISLIEKTDKQVILQGTELEFAWAVVLDQRDGSMSSTLVDRNGAYVLFGSCTPL